MNAVWRQLSFASSILFFIIPCFHFAHVCIAHQHHYSGLQYEFPALIYIHPRLYYYSLFSILYSRTPNETEPLPVELRVPVALADDLLLQPVLTSPTDPASGAPMGLAADAAHGKLGPGSGAPDEKQLGNDGGGGGEDSPRTVCVPPIFAMFGCES